MNKRTQDFIHICSKYLMLFGFSLMPQFGIAQDTISRLEERIKDQLQQMDVLINSDQRNLDSLKFLMTASKNRDLKVKHNIQNDHYVDHLRNRNYLRELLGEIRQLRYRTEKTALQDLRRISDHLKVLEKNKLPDFEQQKIITAKDYVATKTEVYVQPIHHFCQLTKSKDGKSLANEFETLFEFTEPKLDAYYKDSEFLECKARFIKSEKDYFLELKFIFNSPQAEKMIGSIDAASPSRIDFINGSFIYLQALAVTDAQSITATGQTAYQVKYKLDKEDLHRLSEEELDTLTFVWTSGADKYEIVDLDVLQNMFACLKTKN
ncbi:MAG: hypothetical protein IPM92_07845 [Saprospiraceae bacterium]|nr:hypothetical protein [Saprospiraceae bacterium]